MNSRILAIFCVISIFFVACKQDGKELYMAQKYEDALPLLKLQCEQKDAPSCKIVATMYFDGLGVPKNRDYGIKFLGLACESFDTLSCKKIGNIALDSKEYTKAFHSFSIGCDGGDPYSCKAVGNMKLIGIGTDKDPKEALEYLVKACYGGDKNSCKKTLELNSDFKIPKGI